MYRILITLLIGLLSTMMSAGQTLTAREIITKADEKSRGFSSQGEMTMTVVRPGWSRSVSMKTWSKASDYALILITAPPKEKGQVFLKRKTEMWNWIPSIDKIVKIPPSMMLQSWMGSDFTNDDLVKQSSMVIDYTHKLLGKEKIRNVDCYKIELIPLPSAAVVWGKIISWITVEGFDQWRTESYDEDMNLANVENAFDVKKMGDRSIPSRIEIEPVGKKGQKTILEMKNMIFNQPVNDNFFSQQNMKKIR
jgi:outer membrane lipoprotein-sorting protein